MKISQVETIRISCLIYIEILSQSIWQLGISFTDIAVQLVGIGQSVWPVLCLIVGSSHSIALHKCWADCTAERKDLTWVWILDTTAGRHSSSGRSSSKLILQHALTCILYIERSLSCGSLGCIYCHRKVLLIYLNLRTCICGSLLDWRYGRSLTPTVVSHNCKIILSRSLQAFYLIRHLVARILELGIYSSRAQLIQVVCSRESLCAIINHMMVDALLFGLRNRPFDESIVVRCSNSEVGNSLRHTTLLALQSLVSIDITGTHQALVLRILSIQVVYGCGEQGAESLIRELLVTILGKNQGCNTRYMRTCHRGSLVVTIGTVRQGTQYAILLTIVFQTTRGCHINPLATVGIISHASVWSHGTNSHNLVKTTWIIVAFLTIVTGSKDTETSVHLVATTILGEVINSFGNRLILFVSNTGTPRTLGNACTAIGCINNGSTEISYSRTAGTAIKYLANHHLDTALTVATTGNTADTDTIIIGCTYSTCYVSTMRVSVDIA